jgi:hypothetical protein
VPGPGRLSYRTALMPGAGMSKADVTVSAMDTSVILYAAEIEAPALKETARLVLEAEADRFGVSLDGRRRPAAPDRGLRRQMGSR